MADSKGITCKDCGCPIENFNRHGRCKTRCAACQRRAESKAHWERTHGKIKPRLSYTYTCQQCGAVYHPKSKERAQFCSRACKAAHQINAVRAKEEIWAHCQICSSRFIAGRKNSRLCGSLKCRLESERRQAKATAALAHVARAFQCAECDSEVITSYAVKLKRFCSKLCGRRNGARIGRAKRRAIEFGVEAESIDPIKVFRAASWRCYLCGIVTLRSLRGTFDDRAPELDHIIPLTRGGGHTRANVACACRKCNGLKADSMPERNQSRIQIDLFE